MQPTPPFYLFIYCVVLVFKQDISYIYTCHLVSDLHRILEALVLMTLNLGVIF